MTTLPRPLPGGTAARPRRGSDAIHDPPGRPFQRKLSGRPGRLPSGETRRFHDDGSPRRGAPRGRAVSNRRKIKAAPEDAFRAYTGAYQCGHCPGGLRHGPDGWGVYHSEGCPVGAGVIAAGAAGRRAAAAASEQTGVPVMHGSFARHAEENVISGPVEKPNGPRAESIVRWFIGRQAAGALGYCGHIDPGVPGMPPGRGWWAAWGREIIRCQACHLAA